MPRRVATEPLTDKQVKALSTNLDRIDVPDSAVAGGGIRVFASGRKVWFLIYWTPKKGDAPRRQRRKSYGGYPQVSLAEFRRLAQIDKGMLAKGQDPQPELPTACTAAQAAALDKRLLDFFPHGYSLGTFGELAAIYLRRCTWLSKKNRQDEGYLTRDFLPRWRDTPLAEITRAEVVLLLDEIIDRGAPQLSIRTKDVLSALFNFAVDRGLMERNPIAGYKHRIKRNSRERYLSDLEIGQFWRACDQVPHVSSDIYKTILLTACRPGEACAMEWREIQGDWWVIPGRKTKNGKEHWIYITAPLREILDRRAAVSRGERSVFTSAKTEGEAVRYLSYHTKKVRQLSGIPDFRPHDLRRTARTHVSMLGFSDEIGEVLLNHSKKGVAAVYNRNPYEREKREAWTAWAAKVTALTRAIDKAA
jgi:integrase